MIIGASKGLGRALALAFAKEGARLAICCRTAENLLRVLHKPGRRNCVKPISA
ncbi:SDR family NAD(P)-dependent oxidoreductase [Neobacillus muris]|uniref:SDR family NAD(P)-dependent oxidoreductase n=1 Tax=Neobacillus muris TaxID=2941334 RepID=UPI002040B366|nr:SDR family NAD(P)-dependent oxidoreductase [Neobacillus muris]